MSPRLPAGVALVGFGYWGRNLARNIATSSATELLFILDLDPKLREQAGRTFPDCEVVTSLEQICESDRVEAVVIATPAMTHGPIAMSAINAGKHVLIEKPFAASLAEATRISEAAEHAGVVAMAGHTFLYSEPVQFLRRLIASGDLGNVRYAYSQRLNLGTIRSDCDALWNFAPHDVSILQYLLGHLPSSASATKGYFLNPKIADICFATLNYEVGLTANVQVSWIDPQKIRKLTIVGDEAMVVYDDVSSDEKIKIFDSAAVRSDPSLTSYESLGEHQWKTRAGDISTPRLTLREPLLTEIEALASAIREGVEPASHARHACGVIATLEAIDRSADQGGQAAHLERAEASAG